jgi:hypothetical protein
LVARATDVASGGGSDAHGDRGASDASVTAASFLDSCSDSARKDGGSGDRCTRLIDIAWQRVLMRIGSDFVNRKLVLCQNCVRYPLKPRSNTAIYGAIPMHIVVA